MISLNYLAKHVSVMQLDLSALALKYDSQSVQYPSSVSFWIYEQESLSFMQTVLSPLDLKKEPQSVQNPSEVRI